MLSCNFPSLAFIIILSFEHQFELSLNQKLTSDQELWKASAVQGQVGGVLLTGLPRPTRPLHPRGRGQRSSVCAQLLLSDRPWVGRLAFPSFCARRGNET